jgi:hypothetical protein
VRTSARPKPYHLKKLWRINAAINYKFMKKLIYLLCIASLLVLSACSPKSKLAGTWRATIADETRLTLHPEGTVELDFSVTGLLGKISGSSSGTWTLLDGNRLLLEMQTNGVRTTEINRLEFDGDDMVLTSEKTNTPMRYVRIDGPTQKPKETASDDTGRRKLSKEEMVAVNVRNLKNAGEQYMLENGLTEATYKQVAGVYFPVPVSQLGERYDDLVIHQGMPLTLTVKGKTYKAD